MGTNEIISKIALWGILGLLCFLVGLKVAGKRCEADFYDPIQWVSEDGPYESFAEGLERDGWNVDYLIGRICH